MIICVTERGLKSCAFELFWKAHARAFNKARVLSPCLNLPLVPYEPRHENMCLRESPTRQDTNWPAQLQRPARILKFRLYELEVSFCPGSEQQRCWSDCADAQADLRLCCSHMAKTGFLMARLIYFDCSWRKVLTSRLNYVIGTLFRWVSSINK